MEPEPEAEPPAGLFGQPLHRLRRAREPDGVPCAIAHVARTIRTRLRLPGARVDLLSSRGSAAGGVAAASDPGLVRLMQQLEARDDADLELFSVVKLFLGLELWLGMLPGSVVTGALVPEYLAVWQRHDDAPAAVLAARTLAPERRALLDLVLEVVRRISTADTANWARAGRSTVGECPFVGVVAQSLLGDGSQLSVAEAERLVALWLASPELAADTAADPSPRGSEPDDDEADDYVMVRFAVHLNFFLDSSSGAVRCGRVRVTQGVTQLGSVWAKAQGWDQPTLFAARQYQLLTNLETGFITLKVLDEDRPTRLRRAALQVGVVLTKGMVQELQDGDSLSFPGGRFIFEITQTNPPPSVQGGADALNESVNELAAYIPTAGSSPGALPPAAFGTRQAWSGADTQVDDTLQKLRTDILKQFDDTGAAAGRVLSRTSSPPSATSSAEQLEALSSVRSQELQDELEVAKAELRAEQQRREGAERSLRKASEKSASRGGGGGSRHSSASSDGVVQGRSSRSGIAACAQREIAELKMALAATEARQAADAQQLFEVQQLLKQKEAEVTDTKKQVIAEKQRLWAESDLRRKLHNDLQEIRGNIRVLARIRPVQSYPPKLARLPQNCNVVQSDSLVDNQIAIYNGSRKAEQMFEFDACFSNEATNADVFDEVSAAITSVLDGYNVSMMAYGQTGAGKTHTMHGTAEDRGVIFRAVKLLFDKIDRRKAEGYACSVTTSLVEVYNDSIHDLMAPPGKVGMIEQREKLELRTSKSGRKFTVGMQTAPATSSDEVWARL